MDKQEQTHKRLYLIRHMDGLVLMDTGCNLEDLLGAMDDKYEWRGRESSDSVVAVWPDDNDGDDDDEGKRKNGTDAP